VKEICPKCRDVPLKRPSSGTSVARCYHCHGAWIAVEEVADLVRDGSIMDPASMLPRKADGDGLGGLCPEGHGILTRARVEADDGHFHLERCAECRGIWFDAGEWHRLASAHLVSNLDDLWDPSWQRARRLQREDERTKKRLAETLGARLLADLESVAERLAKHPHAAEALAYLSARLRGSRDS